MKHGHAPLVFICNFVHVSFVTGKKSHVLSNRIQRYYDLAGSPLVLQVVAVFLS